MSFFVYRSSAGSGKTYTLVREYLQLALASPQPDYFRHILAITFTNKAADEMKDRVLKKLAVLADGGRGTGDDGKETDPLFTELKKNLLLDDFQLADRAGKLLSHILHNYSDFSISTIDKFTHRVLSTFAHDMRLPVSFNVEVESDELLTEAIDLLLQKAGSDELLTKTLVEFAISRADEDKDWRIEHSLFRLAKILFDEEGHFHVEALKNLSPSDFERIRQNLREFSAGYEKRLAAIANSALTIIADKGISIEDFYYGKNGVGGYFRKIAALNFDGIEGNSYVHKALGEGIWYTDKKPAEIKSAIDEIVPDLIRCWQEIQAEKEGRHSDYLLYQLVAKNIYALSVLTEVEKILNELKVQSNTVHISEFNRLISGVVMYEPAPFIYERLGQRYHHYLVDEFQDTSVLQWINLLPLLDESLAQKHFNMVVGDGKQAIYRWRGGRVEQFMELPKIFLTPGLKGDSQGDKSAVFADLITQREATLGRNIEPKQLSSNFRSKAEIVDFNNNFFEFLSSQLSNRYRGIYEGQRQESKAENTGGFISLDFIETADEYEEKVYAKTRAVIDSLLADGYNLKDIAILTRKNSYASDIARYLLEHDIDVVSSESLLLSQSVKVNFLISLSRYLYNHRDAIAEAEALFYLQQSVSGNLDTYLAEHYPALQAQSIMKYPLYEVFEKMTAAFFGSQPDPYLQFFLDTVHAYTSRNNNDAGEFLEWWEEKKNKISIVVPQGINAVTVMTIHKSKGLEFPAVIYPFAEDEVDVKRSVLWLNTIGKKELAPMKTVLVGANKTLEKTEFSGEYSEETDKTTLDFLNLLYVAFTRPVNRLYVISPFPEKEKESSSSIPYALKSWLEFRKLWEANKLTYTFGSEVSYVSKNEKQDHAYHLGQFISGDWREKLLISRNSRKLWDDENGVTWGNLFHTAISQIFTEKDIVPVLEQMKKEGLIKVDEQAILAEKITTVITRADLKKYFAAGLIIKTEADILLNDGTWLRPDRVIIEGKNAIVIDFKTGRQKDEHRDQLARYAEKLNEMGFEKIEKMLIYTETAEVVFV